MDKILKVLKEQAEKNDVDMGLIEELHKIVFENQPKYKSCLKNLQAERDMMRLVEEAIDRHIKKQSKK